MFSARWGVRMIGARLVGILGAGAGLFVAQWLDFSAGVCVALFLGLAVVACALGMLVKRTCQRTP